MAVKKVPMMICTSIAGAYVTIYRVLNPFQVKTIFGRHGKSRYQVSVFIFDEEDVIKSASLS